MGTPEFAVQSLKALVENNFNVVAVVTVPDKPAGRGLQLQPSPVKKYAEEKKLPVLQPAKLKSPEFIHELRSYAADLQVVVAFRMLPEIVWNMPRLGTINLHASLLPDYRGAAPINWAIINGEHETGVTTFFLKQAIDTGDMIMQEKVTIDDDDTAGTLHDKLMVLGGALIVKTVGAIASGNYTTIPQSGSSEKTAPKIFKEDGRINWHKGVAEINNFVRGLSPYPGAYTYLDEKLMKIFRVETEHDPHQHPPGHLLTDGKTHLKFTAADGIVSVTDLMLEGKKRMRVEEFLRGYSIKTT